MLVPYRRGVTVLDDPDAAVPPALRVTVVTRRRFTARLFRWHAGARRPLLIREAVSNSPSPAPTGPAWRRFVDRWPTPEDLAGAGTHDLLAGWAGLGYNRRALALREAARTIVADHDGSVPRTVTELERLPGIGPYTARAVAATA